MEHRSNREAPGVVRALLKGITDSLTTHRNSLIDSVYGTIDPGIDPLSSGETESHPTKAPYKPRSLQDMKNSMVSAKRMKLNNTSASASDSNTRTNSNTDPNPKVKPVKAVKQHPLPALPTAPTVEMSSVDTPVAQPKVVVAPSAVAPISVSITAEHTPSMVMHSKVVTASTKGTTSTTSSSKPSVVKPSTKHTETKKPKAEKKPRQQKPKKQTTPLPVPKQIPLNTPTLVPVVTHISTPVTVRDKIDVHMDMDIECSSQDSIDLFFDE